MKRALVTGAGGFIGSHLIKYLKARGYWVRGVDIKRPEWGESAADSFEVLDLRYEDDASAILWNGSVDEAYMLAADMGGMGFISANNAQILRNNALININTLDALRAAKVGRVLYTSSACVYPEYRQETTDIPGLKESDAWPAQPQDAYGLEKLVTEELCKHYRRDYGLQTRIARLHNVYGPMGTYKGGREKAPAAMCRKVAEAKLKGPKAWRWDEIDGQRSMYEIEIWGDGEQTRSFCYIDDCVEGLYRLMQSDYTEPLNIGSDRMVTINELADMAADAAGIEIVKRYVDGPQGVRGRNSDNTLCAEVLGWVPQMPLEAGIDVTYHWIEGQVVGDALDPAWGRAPSRPNKISPDFGPDTIQGYSEAWLA